LSRAAKQLSFVLLAAALAGPASGAERAEAARLRSGWDDLQRRASRFLGEPAVAGALAGGGIALDRPALFLAAERALEGGEEGFALLFYDPEGELLCWAGRAPAVLPTNSLAGAVWSAESVLLYQTREVPAVQARKPGHLAFCWRLPRRHIGWELAPAGGAAWLAGDPHWGTIVSRSDVGGVLRGSRTRLELLFVLISLGLLTAALWHRRAPRPLEVLLSVASAAFALTAVLPLLSDEQQLEAVSYFREPAPILGFALAMMAAAAFAAGSHEGQSRLVLASVLAASAFSAGLLWPGSLPVFLLSVLASSWVLFLASRRGRRPGALLAASALSAAGLLGPAVLWKSARIHADADRRSARAEAAAPSPQTLLDAAAGRQPGELAKAAALFAEARSQDLTDLAFFLWKTSGLAAEAPISGIRLSHEGRVVSRFALGIPSDTEDTVGVGGKGVRIRRRQIELPASSVFAPGEMPDQAEIEVGDWPAAKPLPSPLSAYRQLLAGLPAEIPRPESPRRAFVSRLLESFASGTAAFVALLAIAALWRGIETRFRFRPTTFRDRITALFTILVLVPFLAAAVFIRTTVAARLRQETLVHARTALATARTVLDDYLSAAGSSPGRRLLIDDELLSWMAKVVGHDLSIFTNGVIDSTSRRELYTSGLLSGRLRGESVRRLLSARGQPVVESRSLLGRPFDQVQAQLASLPGIASRTGPAVLSIPLLPQQREAEQEIARLSATLAAFTLLVFGLSVLLGARVAYRVTGPIGDLVEGTRAVARGETPAIPSPSDTELKRLVEEFLSMARTLRDQREDLARTNRLKAWAEMARIIAHEVKNPLTPIRLSAEHLREVWRRKDPDAGKVLEECLANILAQTDTLRSIVSEFSDFARLPHVRREDVDVAELVRAAVSSYSAAPRVRWSVRVEAPSVKGDRRLISRALTNLIGNSVEALGETGGQITISAERRGKRVAFRVADDGPGVSEGDFAQLFEPYFSTRSGGGGMGLSIVRRIAQEHGGDARAERLHPHGLAVEFELEDPDV
jgi:signal transduction histidine kinase